MCNQSVFTFSIGEFIQDLLSHIGYAVEIQLDVFLSFIKFKCILLEMEILKGNRFCAF